MLRDGSDASFHHHSRDSQPCDATFYAFMHITALAKSVNNYEKPRALGQFLLVGKLLRFHARN